MLRYPFIIFLLLFASAAIPAQDRCLRLTRLPALERPTDKKVGGDQIWSRMRIEFKSDGSIGNVQPLVFGIDRKLDAVVRDAVKGIEFVPKRVGDQTVTVKRDIDLGYSYSSGQWTITPGVGQCVTQTRLLDDAAENRLTAAAQEFIQAWTDSHDLRRLQDKYFLPGFTAVLASPDMAPAGEELFAQLNDTERRKAFMSFWNYIYLMTVIRHSTPKPLECWDDSSECQAKRRESMLRVLSPDAADTIAREKDRKPKDKAEFLAYMDLFGDIFEKALPLLKKQAPETSIEFADAINLAEDNYNLNYQIKPGVAPQDLKDLSGRVIIAKGEKIYGIETPLLLRLDLVERGNKYKIFNIALGDAE
jgi:hypothetical protein